MLFQFLVKWIKKQGGKKVVCLEANRDEKGKRLWNKVKYQLIDYHSLPAFLKDNEFILGHYRSEWPLKQIFFSVFSIHNETLIVWTHLIGFFLFLTLTIYTAMKIPYVVDLPKFEHVREELKTSLPLAHVLPSLSSWRSDKLRTGCIPERFLQRNHSDVCVLHSMKENVANTIASVTVRPITRWPFFAFLGGAMFCLFASSICHLFSCHSKRLSYIVHRLDYAGIAALISTSFYPPVYYSFMCHPFFCNLYLGFITLLGIAAIIGSLLPVFDQPEFRSIRASLFFAMGFLGVGPILHKLILFWNQPEALHTTEYEVLMGSLYGVGALVYAMRVPERWIPGKVDIAGHSHQLFHILVLAAALTHYRAGLVYLKWRDLEGC